MEISQSSDSISPEQLVGIAAVALLLLYRLRRLYPTKETDNAIQTHRIKMRRALAHLARSLYPGGQIVYIPPKRIAPPLPEKKAERTPELEPEEMDGSPWDPSTKSAQINSHRCKSLLLEIMKRAAHDWVLYRASTRMDRRELANDAFVWLFEEEPGHPRWAIREKSGHTITSFIAICEALDIDPKNVREHIKGLNAPAILRASKPKKEQKRPRKNADDVQQHGVGMEISLEALEQSGDYASYYEAHYATQTLGGV